ncbi:hypothetical protein QBC41DRAFT_52758 [Cercophora samala]|uniref:Uncharacterized protein n=1 Tax=Cercophora samala TaxID=330535 RepID=A0AA40DEN7_9PEZI|nr:hypothetical protein QBC41DRAFT_52758 [Cercophora samala]
MHFTTNLFALAALPVLASPASRPIYYLHQLSQALVKPARFISTSETAQFNFAPYQLTNITLECNRPNNKTNYSCAVDFTLHDPNSVRENNVTSCSCHHGWSWDGVNGSLGAGDWQNPVAGYQLCWRDNSTYFTSSVPWFDHPGNFSLEVAHTYHDDENFTVPWDYPTTIATGEILIEYRDEGDNKKKKNKKNKKKHQKNNNICLREAGPVNATVVGVLD